MVKFYCEGCGYSFSPKDKTKELPKTCPYCNKAGTLQREKTAEELLTEFTADSPKE